MKMTHDFHEMHGFTGSAKPQMEMRPTVHGYARGGMDKVAHGEHHHGDHPKEHGNMHEDKHGFHVHGGRKHKKAGGRVKHESEHAE